MSMGDLPTITDAGHSHTVYGLSNMNQALAMHSGTSAVNSFLPTTARAIPAGFIPAAGQLLPAAQQPKGVKLKKESVVTRRFVQVIIADTNENVPLEDCVLYNGEQKLTDLTDQELFFEIDIKALLAKHNEKRIKMIDRKVKERTEYLEAAKVRDLNMVVVTVASL